MGGGRCGAREILPGSNFGTGVDFFETSGGSLRGGGWGGSCGASSRGTAGSALERFVSATCGGVGTDVLGGDGESKGATGKCWRLCKKLPS